MREVLFMADCFSDLYGYIFMSIYILVLWEMYLGEGLLLVIFVI